MTFLSQLRGLGASVVALAVATGAGVAFALPSTSEVTTGVPAASPVISDEEARELAISSRAAQRQALTLEVTDEAQQRSTALEQTTNAIAETEHTLQARHAAEAKAAADKAAKEKAAKEKAKGTPDTKRLGPPTNAANKELARQMAQSMFGWGEEEFACYDNIIMRESKWDQYADNPRSSAYGIPQALPGKKMASEGADWATNPATQIRWGLKYIKGRYGTPCQAWSFKRAKGWY